MTRLARDHGRRSRQHDHRQQQEFGNQPVERIFDRRRSARHAPSRSVVGVRRKLAGVLYDQARMTPEWVREEHMINSSPGAADALAAIARYFADDVDQDVLGEQGVRALASAVPTLFVWGKADRIIPLSVADEVERLLGVSVVRIPSAGHLPYLENPREFNQALLEFLQVTKAKLREAEGAPTRS